MNSIKLKNPITINGKQVKELTYDTNRGQPRDRLVGSRASPWRGRRGGHGDRPKFYSEIGGRGVTGKRVRRALRDYARVYHTGVTELERKSLIDFLVEYAEAAEQLSEEQERQKQKQGKKPRLYKPQKRR